MSRCLNNPKRTLTMLKDIMQLLKVTIRLKITRVCRVVRKPYAYHRSGGDSRNFLLLPRLSEWAAFSLVPFSELQKGLLPSLCYWCLPQACKFQWLSDGF